MRSLGEVPAGPSALDAPRSQAGPRCPGGGDQPGRARPRRAPCPSGRPSPALIPSKSSAAAPPGASAGADRDPETSPPGRPPAPRASSRARPASSISTGARSARVALDQVDEDAPEARGMDEADPGPARARSAHPIDQGQAGALDPVEGGVDVRNLQREMMEAGAARGDEARDGAPVPAASCPRRCGRRRPRGWGRSPSGTRARSRPPSRTPRAVRPPARAAACGTRRRTCRR